MRNHAGEDREWSLYWTARGQPVPCRLVPVLAGWAGLDERESALDIEPGHPVYAVRRARLPVADAAPLDTHGLARVLDVETAATMASYLAYVSDRLDAGEAVSGPAALRLISAARDAVTRYEGTFLTPRQARALLADPALQVLTTTRGPSWHATTTRPRRCATPAGQAGRPPPTRTWTGATRPAPTSPAPTSTSTP